MAAVFGPNDYGLEWIMLLKWYDPEHSILKKVSQEIPEVSSVYEDPENPGRYLAVGNSGTVLAHCKIGKNGKIAITRVGKVR